MSNPKLFPLDAVFMESPRLKWMKAHGITTTYAPFNEGDENESPETGATIYAWYASQESSKTHVGHHSEIAALEGLAAKLGLPLWNTKGWQ